MTFLTTLVAGALAAPRDEMNLLPCPASLAAAAQAARIGFDESLSLLANKLEPPVRCEDGSEVTFLAIRESWDSCPTTRLTQVFLVCASDQASQASWTRLVYWRRWPTVLGEFAETPCRRKSRRYATPQDLHVDGGVFPVSAVADLESYLEVLDFWEMPYDTPPVERHVGRFGYFGANFVHASLSPTPSPGPAEARINTVVGGESTCNPMPRGLDAFVGHLFFTQNDPVEFLASRREALRERLESHEESSPGR